MAFRCPHCGAELDATLFEFGRETTCSCGRRVAAGHVLKADEDSGETRTPGKGGERSQK